MTKQVARFAAIASANPYPEAEATPKFLHAPDGIERSRLAANIDRHLGVTATARNWRTVRKLLDLAK